MVAPSDKQLIAQLQQEQDAEAFGQLYDRYVDNIYRFIFFKVSDTNEAQDITSDVFLKVWSAIKEKKQGIENFKAYVYRTARNAVVDHYRKNRKNISIDDIQAEELVTKSTVARLLDTDMDTKRVLSALKILKDEYRELIMFKYMNEMSYSEISEITGKSYVNIRVQVHRAVKTLKQLLQT